MWMYDVSAQRWIGGHESTEVRVAEVAPRVWVAWLSDAHASAATRCRPGCGETGAGALADLASEVSRCAWDGPDLEHVIALAEAWSREIVEF